MEIYDTLPYSNDTTSKDAARSMVSNASTLREKVYQVIINSGDNGATDLEIQAALDIKSDTEVPRRYELVKANLVKDSGKTRLTPSNRKSIVWVATNEITMA